MAGAWRDNFIRIKPYVAGERPETDGVVKLNANENPYPPAPGVEAVLRGADADGLRRYPPTDGGELRRALADDRGTDIASVFVANGSDEALALAFRAFFNSDKPVLFPSVTYSFYRVWCDLFGIPFRRVVTGADLRVRPEDYFSENGGVVIANPNAQTGVALGADEIERVVFSNADSVVIVDEAYVDFGARSVVGLISKYGNLLVTQTFSKGRALAGLRLGMAFGDPELISVLDAVKNSFNSYPVDSLAAAAGVASLADRPYFEARAAQVAATRERVAAALRGLGFSLTDSAANFLFMTHEDVDAPVTRRYLRVTVGTDAEMDAFTGVAEEFLRTRGKPRINLAERKR
jgi:histidinol-phosphate aminotransferase